MRKGKLFILSVVGTVICSMLCVGCSSKSNESVSNINTQEHLDNRTYKEQDDQKVEIDDYWENTSIEEIRKSILAYINNMMNSTVVKLEDFRKNNNEDKIKLYESEIERLNIICKNVKESKTKQELRQSMQVRHKRVL